MFEEILMTVHKQIMASSATKITLTINLIPYFEGALGPLLGSHNEHTK